MTVSDRTHFDYYPFGSIMQTRSWAGGAYSYGFNGKEKNNEISVEGGSYDFGARIYEGRLGRWWSTDSKYSKFPSLSPFNFGANNPIYLIDPDGKDIYPYHIKGTSVSNGAAIYDAGKVSANTESVILDLLKTPDGFAFFSQFAKKDQTIGEYTFMEDGIHSDHDLYLYDYSFENYDLNKVNPDNAALATSYNDKKGNLKFVLPIYSKGQSTLDIATFFVHEIGLHGYKTALYTNAFSKLGKKGYENTANDQRKNNYLGEQDHLDLKNKNEKSTAYKNYVSLRDQLIKVSEKYAQAFNILIPSKKLEPIKRPEDKNNSDNTANYQSWRNRTETNSNKKETTR